MAYYPEPIAKLIESYAKLPGIGQKNGNTSCFLHDWDVRR